MKNVIAVLALCLVSLQASAAQCVIGEYSQMGDQAGGGSVPVWGTLVAEQSLTVTTLTVSAAFNTQTRFIRVQCDEKVHFVIGLTAADPTAATTNQWVEAGAPEGFGTAGGRKIAMIDGA
jgi:hypothetical protein